MILIRASLSFLVLVAGFGYALAHDLRGLVAEKAALPSDVRTKFAKIEELRRLLAARASTSTSDGQIEAVVQQGLRWPGGNVSVCFFDGGEAAREHVVQVASKWQQGTNLKFDFGPAGSRRQCGAGAPSNVRVSFSGVGYYSYVGTQAKYVHPSKQTMNLEGLDKVSFSKSDDGVILHEFGHAIGFEHEHQSPMGGCQNEFNWTYLYTSMGWSKEEVDRNMAVLDYPSRKNGLLVTKFDRSSIMLYALSPAAFIDASAAKCYIPRQVNEISSLDRGAAAAVYPAASTFSPARTMPQVDLDDPNSVAVAQAVKEITDFTAGVP